MTENHHCHHAERSDQHPVGAKLKRLQDRLLELGARLKRETDANSTALISKALEAIQNQRLTVSIIGQVSAGKTTLVNALARQPELLPVSQAPWTAVITRLHFGLHGFPEHSSHFRFFDESEWQRLAQNGGRLRELAERFLPGFNSEQLQQQVQAMRHRAAARLGADFQQLLGTTHSFTTLKPAVISQYVSVGLPGDSGKAEAQPNYADITRTADLFLPLVPFGYPMTLIDTPGTNDPFLVREEITLRSLDASAACIVVLDAKKGVTESDLGLFRILRGISTKRLILFINKIDLLNDESEQPDVITGRIASIARQELGNAQIPVITGSAHAEATESTGATSNDPMTWLKPLEDALSGLVHHGHTSHYVHQAAATLMTLADGVRSQAAAQIGRLQNERATSRAHFDDQVGQARAVVLSEELAEQITRTTNTAISSLHRISAAYEMQAVENLRKLVQTFAASKKADLLKRYPNTLPTNAVRIDINDLRQRILGTHAHDYRRVRREISNTIRVAAAQLTFLINQMQSDATVNLDFNALSEDFMIPSQAPLGRALAIDLEEPFWRRWWRRRLTTQEAAETLEALIVQEFDPIISELVKINKAELEIEIDYSALQLSINGTNLVHSVKENQSAIPAAALTKSLSSGLALAEDVSLERSLGPPLSDVVNSQNWQQRFDFADSRHRRAELLVRELKQLALECRGLLN